MQAYIKKKVEKQRKRSIDAQSASHKLQELQRSREPAQMAEEKAENSETMDEELEEMLAGGQRRNVETVEEAEPVDLLPIVDSVFGQVGRLCLIQKTVLFVPVCPASSSLVDWMSCGRTKSKPDAYGQIKSPAVLNFMFSCLLTSLIQICQEVTQKNFSF